jgi:hypothetical protein
VLCLDPATTLNEGRRRTAATRRREMRRLTYAAAISLGGLIDEYEAA